MGSRTRSLYFCCAIAAACALGAVNATAAELETVRVPARVESAAWSPPRLLLSPWKNPEGPRTFTLYVDNGYCLGLKPELDHIEVVERPVTKARPFKSAVITVFKRWPEHDVYVPPPTESGQPKHISVCFGIGGAIIRRVKLKRPVASLYLYDGSYSPPRQVLTPRFQQADPIPPPTHR